MGKMTGGGKGEKEREGGIPIPTKLYHGKW